MPRLSFCAILVMILAFGALDGPAAVAAAPPKDGAPAAVVPSANYPKIVLYSTSWCPHCSEARNYFNSKGIPFTERDVEEDDSAMEDVKTKYKSRGVPVIVIGNDQKILKGFQPATFESAVKEVQKQK